MDTAQEYAIKIREAHLKRSAAKSEQDKASARLELKRLIQEASKQAPELFLVLSLTGEVRR